MLQISSSLASLIQDNVAVPFFLVKLEFTSGTIGITDAPRDIDYSGDTYTADGGLKSISPPKAEADISRDLFNIVVTDADNVYRQLLRAESVGVPVTVMAGFVDPATGIIDSEYLPVYAGKISKVAWEINDNDPLVTVECSGPFTKLKQITNRSTNSANQKLYYPNDTSMDKSYDSSNEATIKWGGNS